MTANDWICVDGNEAAARLAHRLSEVIAIYPITPAGPPPTTRPAAERVDVAFLLAVAAILAFAFTNGFHDAANAIATLVATRGAAPGPAIILAAACNMLGPLLLGAAVADTIAGIVGVTPAQTIPVVGAA